VHIGALLPMSFLMFWWNENFPMAYCWGMAE
jgi:hypothetical protein